MYKNVLQILEKTGELFPHNKAFSDDNGYISYYDVILKAKSIGTFFAREEVRGRAIAVVMNKSKEALVGFMGIIYSGNFYVPIDTKMPDERIQKIFETVNPYAILADKDNFERMSQYSSMVFKYESVVACAISEDVLARIRKKSIDTDPIYALFTSGSTGVPKGVICCHRSVINYSDWLIDTFKFDESTIFGNQTQFYFSMSVLDIYATIRSGAELHIIPHELFTFPIKLLEHMNEHRINAIYWVPTALCVVANLRALKKVDMPYLNKILFAGEAMPTKQLNIWRKYLPNALYANLFGPTEITDIGIYYIVNREFADDEPLPIGIACENVDYIILDEDGKQVECGQKGELCIRGSYLAMGYYNNFEKTEEVFIQNPLNPNYPELIYKTGDLVSINTYGELMYHGRKDFQIKHQGNRIELGEIEVALGGIGEVDNCACIYDDLKKKIVLFYEGAGITAEELRELLSAKIPGYMQPNIIIRLDVFPCNANGKIDRKGLKGAYLDGKINEFGAIL